MGVSPDFVHDAMAENVPSVYVELITFEAEGEPTGYMVLDPNPIVSRGNTYLPADAAFEAAKLTGQELSTASVTFSNVSRDLIGVLRQAHEKPTITAELICVDRPDVVEQTHGPYEAQDVTFTTSSIQIKLRATQVFDEQFPTYTYNPAQSPAVYA